MPAPLILTGMACGALLTVIGLTLWGASRQVPRLSHAVRAIRWLAGVLLLIGTLFAFQSTPIAYPILMAALAAPPGSRRRRPPHRSDVLLILPSLILAGASLFWGSTSIGIKVETSSFSISLTELAIVICGGLGTRALGQSLSDVAAPPSHTKESTLPAAATCALLTLLMGSTALVNLWQRGAMWEGSVYEGRLAGAWLAWSATWLSPRRPQWLRAVLTTVAALLLIILAAG
ncbi:MAG: hypothetical protein V3S14_14860 [Anaerolineae bacterium]